MPTSPPLDPSAPSRLPVTAGGGQARRRSSSKGWHFPADPPRTEEIIAVMRCCDGTEHGARARALIVVLWPAGLRIQEALNLNELDLDRRRGSVLVRRGKGGRRREIGMDDWGLEQPEPWLTVRRTMPVGPLFCVINGPTRGRPWQPAPARAMLRRLAARAGVRRRFAPPQLRHAHAIELAHEGVSLNVIQRQLGHRNLGVTSIYLQGIDPDEIMQTVHARRAPMIPDSVGLALAGLL
jgi:site-specific recombinase XerD